MRNRHFIEEEDYDQVEPTERRGRRGRSKKMSVTRKIVIFFEVLLLLAVIVGGIVLATIKDKYDLVQQEDITVSDSVDEVVKNNEVLRGYTNIAVFGVDARDGSLDALNHTDTIIICSINNDTKKINLVSIYRDLLIKDIKGKDAFGNDYEEGVFRKATESYYFGGPQSAVAMLNANLDLNISSYVTVNWEIVTDVVDAVDGIDVELSQAEVDQLNYYIEETASGSGKAANHISEPGLHHLDGVQATTYARIREIDSDFKRTERQRLVIQKVLDKAKQFSLTRINRMADAILPKVKTNMKLEQMLKLGLAIKDYSIGESSGFPYQLGDANYYGAAIVVAMDLRSNVAALHEKLFGEKNYQPSPTLEEISAELDIEVGQTGAVPVVKPESTYIAPIQEPQYDPQPTPQPEPIVQPTPQPQPDQQPEPTPQPQPDQQPEPTPQPDQQPEPTPQPQPDQQPEPTPQPQPQPDQQPEPTPQDAP